jgi:YfiH family protein
MTTAVPDFRWGTGPVGRTLHAVALEAVAPHLFTTRDVSFRGAHAADHEDRLAAAFGPTSQPCLFATQVHGRSVARLPARADLQGVDADAIVSTDPTRVIGVRVADCVPILLADVHHRAVAAIHAGWRGTAAGVARAAIDALAQGGVPAADLVAAIGPSIGPCCYQVDQRVRRAFLTGAPTDARWGAGIDAERWFAPDGDDRWRLDLWQANADQLQSAGVPASAIHLARFCTADHLDTCFSYRAEGPGTGRLVAAIQLAERAARA